MKHSLYIVNNNVQISSNGGKYVIKRDDIEEEIIGKEMLESVSVYGYANITNTCMKDFLKKGIGVNFYSKNGYYYGRLGQAIGNNVHKLKKQIYLSDNLKFRYGISKKIIIAKIQNQIVILKRYQKNNDLNEEITAMQSIIHKIEEMGDNEKLLGYEGTCAKYYFKGISKIIDEEFKFKGRSKKPPKDPFNSMLSFGYTMLSGEIYGVIIDKGLSPYVGFYHKDRIRHPSLASDLIEEWRPVIIDSIVISLINGKEINTNDFDIYPNGKVLFRDEGINKFISKYEERMECKVKYINGRSMSLRGCIYSQVESLSKSILNEDYNIYEPIRIR